MTGERADGLIQALRGLYRTEGVRGLAQRVLARVGARDTFAVLRLDLARALLTPTSRVAFTLQRLDDETLASFRYAPYPFSRHYQYRFDYGQRRCYAAFVHDRIAALMWPSFAADNRRVVSRWRALWPDEGRIGSIWCDPAYRGTGLMGACVLTFGRHLQRHGFRYLYAFTWHENVASITMHERLGFERVGTASRYSLRWQKEGRGLYVRSRIHRADLAPGHPGGDPQLPDVLAS